MSGATYLVDLYPFKPPEENFVVYDDMVDGLAKKVARIRETGDASDAADLAEMADFSGRIFEKSGLSKNGTYLPRNINPAHSDELVSDLNAAMAECSTCIFGAMDGLLAKTNLQVKDIDIVVTTCSIYCPTPSMASMLVNHFKLKSSVQAYHLGGMGCSNGVTALNLVRDLLKARPNSNAILVTTETLSPGVYKGRDRSRLLGNVIFRMGAAAVLLSNKKSWGENIKYTLVKAARAHGGSSDAGYRCIWQGPDDKGLVGVHLSKEVAYESGKTLTKAMTAIAPTIMTWKQISDYMYNELKRKMGYPLKRYTPNFSDCVDHFLIHAGGAKILDVLGKELKLNKRHMEPSYAVLHDYGNVSSSTTWYSMAWLESCRGVNKGDRVLQIGVGSGVKAGVAVWEAAQDIVDVHDAWVHSKDALPSGQGTLKVSGAHGWQYFAHRVLFIVLMLLFGALMYSLTGAQSIAL